MAEKMAERIAEILKESELKPFYDIYPQKFNNKTNGITFRRWLVHCNHNLAEYLKELIGPGYMERWGIQESSGGYYCGTMD